MADPYSTITPTPDGPYRHAAAVTPSDTVDLTTAAYAIFVGAAGNITLITVNGETVAFNGLAAGTCLRVATSRVKSTGTTATSLVALW